MLPSSSSQSEDIANLPRQSLPNGVHIVQYLESSAAFEEAVDEGVRVGMEYCPLTDFLVWGTGWLIHFVPHPWFLV